MDVSTSSASTNFYRKYFFAGQWVIISGHFCQSGSFLSSRITRLFTRKKAHSIKTTFYPILFLYDELCRIRRFHKIFKGFTDCFMGEVDKKNLLIVGIERFDLITNKIDLLF